MSDYRHHRVLCKALGCAIALALVGLPGCAPQHRDAIMFGVNTTGGLKVGVDEKQLPTIIIGYNRQEAALVPLFVYGDGMFKAADRNVDATIYLEGARKRFERAAGAGAPALRQKLTEEGILLVNWAYEASEENSAGGTGSGRVSPGLSKLHALAQKPTPNLTELTLLTETEIQRPSTALRYLEEYKYMGEIDRTVQKDAYSVLGTFSGGAKGKAQTGGAGDVVASGSIAQYFATGIAAQNLSLTPASVTANSQTVKEAATLPASEARERFAAFAMERDKALGSAKRYITVKTLAGVQTEIKSECASLPVATQPIVMAVVSVVKPGASDISDIDDMTEDELAETMVAIFDLKQNDTTNAMGIDFTFIPAILRGLR